MASENEKYPGYSLEENFKKTLTEMLVLSLLAEQDRYIGELTTTISQRSGNTLNIVFPYGAVYRLEESGYIDFIVWPHLLNAARRAVTDPLTVDKKGVAGIGGDIDPDLCRHGIKFKFPPEVDAPILFITGQHRVVVKPESIRKNIFKTETQCHDFNSIV